MHKIEVPPELQTVDELIIPTSYPAKSPDDPAFALYVVYPNAGLVEVLPQKWFTASQYQVGKQWIPRAARDPESHRYRIWYNNGAAVWHAESDDGIAWRNPQKVWETSHCFGASLIDEGPSAADPARRYKLANWQATRGRDEKKGDNSGIHVGVSPDGLRWSAYDHNPVLSGWPEGYGKITRHGVGDIVDVYFDPLRRRYAAAPPLGMRWNAVRISGP
jgi:hypothetical protein